MPRLLTWLPCQRCVVDQQDSSLYLHSVLTSVRVFPQDDNELEGQIPLRWTVFSLWEAEAGDSDAEWRQKIELKNHEGRLLLAGELRLSLDKPLSRAFMPITSFPLAGVGRYLLSLSVGLVSEGDPGLRQIAEYPIRIESTPQPPAE